MLLEALANGQEAYRPEAWEIIVAEAAARGVQTAGGTPTETSSHGSAPASAPQAFPEYLAFLLVSGAYAALLFEIWIVYGWATTPSHIASWSLNLRAWWQQTLPWALPAISSSVIGLAFGDAYPRLARLLVLLSAVSLLAFLLVSM